jgi:hypothetical protein
LIREAVARLSVKINLMAKKSHLKSIEPATTGSAPPATLGKAGATLWQTVVSEFEIDDSGSRETLLQVCQAKDSLEDIAARKAQAGSDHKAFQPYMKAEIAFRAFISRTLERLVGPEKKSVGRPNRGFGWVPPDMRRGGDA